MRKNWFLKVPVAIICVISAAISLIYRFRISDIDAAIISYGYRTVNRYRSISNMSMIVAIAMSLVFLLMIVIFKKNKSKQRKLNLKEESSPERAENKLVERLTMLAKDIEPTKKADSAKVTIKHIRQINDLISRFESLYIDQNTDVFERVGQSIEQAKEQIMQNSRSIVNRITIEGCEDEVENKTINNRKIINNVRVLLNETVDYLDNKTTTSTNLLESITSSLRILNQTIYVVKNILQKQG